MVITWCLLVYLKEIVAAIWLTTGRDLVCQVPRLGGHGLKMGTSKT